MWSNHLLPRRFQLEGTCYRSVFYRAKTRRRGRERHLWLPGATSVRVRQAVSRLIVEAFHQVALQWYKFTHCDSHALSFSVFQMSLWRSLTVTGTAQGIAESSRYAADILFMGLFKVCRLCEVSGHCRVIKVCRLDALCVYRL